MRNLEDDADGRSFVAEGHDGEMLFDPFVDPASLRWVGTQFVYFVDIPWIPEMHVMPPCACACPPSPPGRLTIETLSVRAMTTGLLEKVMRTTLPANELVSRDRRGNLVLAGTALAQLIVPWARCLCNLFTSTDAEAREHRAWGVQAFQDIVRVVSDLDNAIYAEDLSLLGGQNAELLCAVATFFASLSRCVRTTWPDSVAHDFLEIQTRMFGEVLHIFRDKLEETWGRRASVEVERLLGGGLGIPFVAYAISCTPTVSRVDKVDTANYKPQHTTPSCRCNSVAPPITHIKKLLERSEVPIVTFDGDALVVREASQGPYVAISHVWADGLGSTSEEGLPLCQVKRVDVLVRQLIPFGAFWQDSLCVPSDKPLRKRAIGLMAHTYAQADKVLVIDGGVRTQCSLSTPKEECLLRIATCGWVQRVWTLQEGMLARELYFELQDGLVDCTHFNGEAYHAAAGLVPMFQYRPRDDASLSFVKRSSEVPRCTVNDVITLLRYRTTSHPADEPLAISGLLGVNAAELVRYDSHEERMKAFFIKLRELPRQLAVFGWICPRLRLPQFTWAPKSLSAVLWPGDPGDPLVATCTEEGLFGVYTVVRLPDISLGRTCGVVAVIEDGPGNERDDHHGQCTRAGCASRIFHFVLSPHFFYGLPPVDRGMLTFNAFLMKQCTLPESMHEEGVGVVYTMPTQDSSTSEPMHCKFVAPGSARWGIPDTVETTRTRGHWHFVKASVVPSTRVRVT